MVKRADVRSANHVTIKGGISIHNRGERGGEVAVLKYYMYRCGCRGIGGGIGIGFGIFHTPNPCDGMRLSIVDSSSLKDKPQHFQHSGNRADNHM